MLKLLRRLWVSEAGSITIIAAFALPVLVGMTGIAIDYAAGINQSHKLQAVADSAALRAARELYLANANETTVTEIARRDAAWNLDVQSIGDPETAEITVVVDSGAGTVQVDITEDAVQFFTASIFHKMGPVTVSSQARIYGGSNICVIGLDENQRGTVQLKRNAKLTAPECAVYSNANDRAGLELRDQARMTAKMICSSGGYVGNDNQFAPPPITDCPVMPDPLANRRAPTFSGCEHKDFTISKGTHTLDPGVYCGGLRVIGSAIANLKPGTYVMDDGPLQVSGSGVLMGENVGFFLTGDKIGINFSLKTTIDLTAPRTGDMAGLLFFADRSSGTKRPYRITSDNARNLLGTVYLPNGTLMIDSSSRVADQSAYTVIIVRQLQLFGGPDLVLNTGYGDTNIPVPKGVGPMGGVMISK